MKHSDETRARAVELLANPEMSYCAVRDATGVPVGTLAGWAKQHNIERSDAVRKTEAATKARIKRIESKRSKLAEKQLDAALVFVDKARTAAGAPAVQDPQTKLWYINGDTAAKNLMAAHEIAVKGFRLEMGEATEVQETRTNEDAADVAKKRVDELAGRRKAKSA